MIRRLTAPAPVSRVDRYAVTVSSSIPCPRKRKKNAVANMTGNARTKKRPTRSRTRSLKSLPAMRSAWRNHIVA